MKGFIKKTIVLFNTPIFAFLISLAVYTFLSFFEKKPWSVSDFPYFNYLADAFLHGQLDFRIIPPSLHDLVFFNDKIYSYWAPFPDVLFVPFVKIFGLGFSDILLTIVIASANVFLFSNLLLEANQNGITSLDDFKRSLMAIFYTFGTVTITLAPLGRIWFSALIIGQFAILFTYFITLKYEGWVAFLLVGVGMSAAFATRMNLILLGIWPAYYLLLKNISKPKKKLLGMILSGMFPLIITFVMIGFYNYFRFGSFLENGLRYHNMSELFREGFERFGLFNTHYFLRNFYYQFIAYPFLARNPMDFFTGGSLFLLSPVFFVIFNLLKKERMNWDYGVLFITFLAANIPILLYMNTGFLQFGPRFSMDYMAPLLLLTAAGARFVKRRTLFLLVLISIFHYVVGFFVLAKFG